MPYPHLIRLRGPWEYQVLDAASASSSASAPSADPGTPARQTLPADWSTTLGPDFHGRVLYCRRFNRPTGLDATNRVWLVIEGVDAQGRYSLNGHALGTIDGYALPAMSDVTELLASANVLEVEVELPADIAPSSSSSLPAADRLPPATARPGRDHLAGGLIGEVRLEIRAAAHINGLTAYWQTGSTTTLHIAGQVEGREAGKNVSLVVTACDRELAFREVSVGKLFALELPIDDWPCWPDPLDEPPLTPVEIRLSASGQALWQTTIETAPPQPDDARPRQAMLARVLGSEPIEWLDYIPQDSPAWQQLLARPTAVVGLRAVLSDAAYHELDLANVGVVQQLPLHWAQRVCQRLAHHPSIMAWSAPAAEMTRLAPAALDAISFGRPWVAAP